MIAPGGPCVPVLSGRLEIFSKLVLARHCEEAPPLVGDDEAISIKVWDCFVRHPPDSQ